MADPVAQRLADLPQRGADAKVLLDTVVALREAVVTTGSRILESWGPPARRRAFRLSAANLAAYLALRRYDLRPLQTALMPWGLSSLGRCEGRVTPNLDAVAMALATLAGLPPPAGLTFPGGRRYFRGQRLLERNTTALFGPRPDQTRQVRILVTLPAEAGGDPGLLESLVAAGTDAVRINTAHDTPDCWARMIQNLRAAETRHGRRVRVLMDLAGPKVRTEAVLFPQGDRKLEPGEEMLLTGGPFPARTTAPYQALCSIPSIPTKVKVGDRVYLDDGKVGGVVDRFEPPGPIVRITSAEPGGHKLKPEKGLNFPDTDLGLDALTDEDREALAFVARHADMVGYSFVQSGSDVRALQAELARHRPSDWDRLALVAKIETPRAVRNLPEIITAAAARQPFAVMIARGDLAVELGFERTAEMQEEILWLAEAAHVPVIWATQVLESLVKTGLPTRGEMTDAAMAARAECVMLNKGPRVVEALHVLDVLLSRMAEHQAKKTPKLRALRSWEFN